MKRYSIHGLVLIAIFIFTIPITADPSALAQLTMTGTAHQISYTITGSDVVATGGPPNGNFHVYSEGGPAIWIVYKNGQEIYRICTTPGKLGTFQADLNFSAVQGDVITLYVTALPCLHDTDASTASTQASTTPGTLYLTLDI